jgi:cell division septum initiation protein DivIVA
MPTAREPKSLPTGFRGYDRAATDSFLADLERRHAGLAAERDALRRRLDDLTAELEQHRGRSEAVADALVTAQKIAVDLREAAAADIAEERREVAEERRRLVDEGVAIRTEARQEATEIVREARIRADRLIEEIVAALADYQRETADFVTGTRERLTSLVQDLLARIPGSAPEPAPVVVEVDADAESEPEAPSADVAAA